MINTQLVSISLSKDERLSNLNEITCGLKTYYVKLHLLYVK